MEDLKNKIEALLYAAGRAVSLNEIEKICKTTDENAINHALQDLKIDYDNRDSSLMLVNDNNNWKIVTKENYFGVVKKVVSETELPKSLMETLAVIAWKYPIKQCDLIKVRTNKAYDHLNELENLGYISRQKHGRTKLIKLTDKFFSYFDLPPDKLKQKFSDFNQIAAAIVDKEKEIESLKEEHKQQVEEAKTMQEQSEQKQLEEIQNQEKEIDLLDKQGNTVKLEQYAAEPEKEPEKNKIGLEVYESQAKDEKLEDKVIIEEREEDEEPDEVPESPEEPAKKELEIPDEESEDETEHDETSSKKTDSYEENPEPEKKYDNPEKGSQEEETKKEPEDEEPEEKKIEAEKQEEKEHIEKQEDKELAEDYQKKKSMEEDANKPEEKSRLEDEFKDIFEKKKEKKEESEEDLFEEEKDDSEEENP